MRIDRGVFFFFPNLRMLERVKNSLLTTTTTTTTTVYKPSSSNTITFFQSPTVVPTQVSSQSQREHETRILWYPTTDQGSSRFCSLRGVGDQARMLATSGREIRHTWVPRMFFPPRILTSNQNLPFHSPISPKPFLGVVDLPTSVASFSPPEIRHFFSFLVFEPSLNPPLFMFVPIQMPCPVFKKQ